MSLPAITSDALLRRHHRFRRPADRDELVRRFRPLARKLAHRYSRGPDQGEDLEQIACLGLLKAIDRFDPDRGFAFSSFAVPTILGELRRSFRDTAWAAHVPRSVQERVARVRSEADAWLGRHGRTPTVAELANVVGCGEEEVVEALQAAASLSPVSLDGPTGAGQDDDDVLALADRLGDTDPGFELAEDRVALAAALPTLTDAQQEVIHLRFTDELKQSEIADRIGVSQMQVSRVLRAGLYRLSTVATHQSRA